ncbi:hypothetical protein [Pseudoalteromonas sp. APC 3691]|uniref:DUF7668 domain-containing protein n=1 Tax=Pseudoalteromonas sp. APC 3691 TaxID=3035173 RepID=UPI0025B34CEE|nr:hypothetical protein [Pseudoalteromonas sp. APC 3691]MDN3391404.1 hypothetical protein [Pseudoalteromonas sp. APC 3691]
MDAIKDLENEHLIASHWRPIIKLAVDAFSQNDFGLSTPIENIQPIPVDIALANKSYVSDYGEVLINLPEETWETSCAQWMGDYWQIIVDLFTEDEGRSDLVLNGRVMEKNGNLSLEIGLIYVP